MSKYLILLFSIFILSGCKKEPKQSISLCASQFDNVVDLHIRYDVAERGGRSFVYRAEGNQPFNLLREINPNDIVGDSFFLIDSTVKKNGNYTYKVSNGWIVSNAVSVGFEKGTTTFYVPNSVKDTLTIQSSYRCDSYSFQLYNRWGQLIIDKQNLSGNQSFDVSTQPKDTYIYRVILGKRDIRNTIGFMR